MNSRSSYSCHGDSVAHAIPSGIPAGLTKWTPAPCRVRVWQNGHGVYICERLVRSNRYPQAHWGVGPRIPRPPRVERTPAQIRAMARRALETPHDMFR